MPKIKIEDLPKDEKISTEKNELKQQAHTAQFAAGSFRRKSS